MKKTGSLLIGEHQPSEGLCFASLNLSSFRARLLRAFRLPAPASHMLLARMDTFHGAAESARAIIAIE